MTCAQCGAETGRRYAKYCDACRWRHRGKRATYVLTAEAEAYLRAYYTPAVKGYSLRCARVLNVPKWRVTRWAAELGLSYPQGRRAAWTPEEDALLESWYGKRHVNWIAKQLHRSVTAVTVRAKRIGLSRRAARDWWTARDVALGFGVDPSTVVRWIARGWLQARHEGQDHPDGRAAMWRISEGAVRRFIREQPTAFLLAKVDQTWFLDLVCGLKGAREIAA